MPKRKRVSEDVVRVPLLPNFASACSGLLARAIVAGKPIGRMTPAEQDTASKLSEDEIEGLELLRSAISEALVEYLRGGRP